MIFIARDTSMHHVMRNRFSPPEDADVRRAAQKLLKFWTTGHYVIAKDAPTPRAKKGMHNHHHHHHHHHQHGGDGHELPADPPAGGEADPFLSAMQRDILAGGRATTFAHGTFYPNPPPSTQREGLGDVERGAAEPAPVDPVVRREPGVRPGGASAGGRGDGVASAVLVGYEDAQEDENEGDESDDDAMYERMVSDRAAAMRGAGGCESGRCGHHHHHHGGGGHGGGGGGGPMAALWNPRPSWEKPTEGSEMAR
jgi:hypothetical protein